METEIKSMNKIGKSSDTKRLHSQETCEPVCCVIVFWMCLL